MEIKKAVTLNFPLPYLSNLQHDEIVSFGSDEVLYTRECKLKTVKLFNH